MGKIDRIFATKNPPHFTPKVTKFRHLELLGPLSCNKVSYGACFEDTTRTLPRHLRTVPFVSKLLLTDLKLSELIRQLLLPT